MLISLFYIFFHITFICTSRLFSDTRVQREEIHTVHYNQQLILFTPDLV